MVNSQEIIERSIYSAILNVAVAMGYSINPNDYLPVSELNSNKFKEDIKKLKKYIDICGTGNSSSRDKKITPRIVVNSKGFYPGDIGIPKELLEKKEGIGFVSNEEPYETLDQYIDVHLVANNQEDIRLLHQIMFHSLPQRGYIKPYNEDKFLFSGNIFLEVDNFFDYSDNTLGIIEKVYEYKVFDTLIGEIQEKEVEIVPITSIEVLLDKYGYNKLIIPSIIEGDFDSDFNKDFSGGI